MSDIVYGTPDRPFYESLDHIAEFRSGGAVKWATAPFSYLEPGTISEGVDSGIVQPEDSYTGTASFWFRVNGTLASDEQKFIPIVFVPGPRIFEGTPGVFDIGFEIFLYRNPILGSMRCGALIHRQPGTTESIFLVDSEFTQSSSPTFLPMGLFDDAWGHVHITWDALSATGLMTVNRIPYGPYITAASTDWADPDNPLTVAYEAYMAPWTETIRFFGARPDFDAVAVIPPESLSDNYLISLAHVWIDTVNVVTDVSKFVTDENRPARMGPGGELMIPDPDAPEVESGQDPPMIPDPTTRPAYYFKGGPSRFLENRGNGGPMTLVGAEPIKQPGPVEIGT